MQEIKLSIHEKKEYYICTKVFSFDISKHTYCSLFLILYSSLNVQRFWQKFLITFTLTYSLQNNSSPYIPDKISIFKIFSLHVDLAFD